MNKRIRNLLAALGIAGAITAGAVGLRNLPQEEFTIEEYQVYIAMLNYEIERAGGQMYVRDIKRERNGMIKAIEKEILKRDVVESAVILNGEAISRREYKALRSELIKRRK